MSQPYTTFDQFMAEHPYYLKIHTRDGDIGKRWKWAYADFEHRACHGYFRSKLSESQPDIQHKEYCDLEVARTWFYDEGILWCLEHLRPSEFRADEQNFFIYFKNPADIMRLRLTYS